MGKLPVSQLLPPETRFWKRTTLRAVLFSRVVWGNCDVGGTAATDKGLCIVHGLAWILVLTLISRRSFGAAVAKLMFARTGQGSSHVQDFLEQLKGEHDALSQDYSVCKVQRDEYQRNRAAQTSKGPSILRPYVGQWSLGDHRKPLPPS